MIRFQPFNEEKLGKINTPLLKNKGAVCVRGLNNGAMATLINFTGKGNKLCIFPEENEARKVFENLKYYYEENLCFFSAKDYLFGDGDVMSSQTIQERINCIKSLCLNPSKETICVTTITALMEKTISKEAFNNNLIKLSVGDTIDVDNLIKKLVYLGYERNFQVESKGQFALRGEIIDIYSLCEERPIRINLFDTDIESLKYFSEESQISNESLESFYIYPQKENLGEGVILDYFKDNTVYVGDIRKCVDTGRDVENVLAETHIEGKEVNVEGVDLILEKLSFQSLCLMETFDSVFSDFEIKPETEIQLKCQGIYEKNFVESLKTIRSLVEEKNIVIVTANTKLRVDRILKDFEEANLRTSVLEKDEIPKPGHCYIAKGALAEGYLYPEGHFALFSEKNIYGNKTARQVTKKKFKAGEHISKYTDLNVGDYVVDDEQGIGKYLGIEKLENDGISSEYLKLQYENGTLYVPVTRLDCVAKYASKDAEIPHLSKIDGEEWVKTRTKAKREVEKIAEELVKLYAERANEKGYRFSPDNVWQKEFEETFEFVETEDQLRAIEATKEDMESSKPMDRLVCGDVGYGKTEVALRAAFKAVQDSKQVAYLVPTTILAKQIYDTFVGRMQGYPIRIQMISRFHTNKENKNIISGLAAGTVDIVIGTHRLLSKDIVFKDLGLLVVDEEQRFGVKHKEQIKHLRKNVDVLTLTATPIPRTLHMSLSGIRDISVLEEAPQDRKAVQTYVMEYNKEVIREAITRELKRKGQVFYVHNRVNDIERVASIVRELVPNSKVEVAHGKMDEEKLEEIMYRFIAGEIDVLIATTIIESGIDIPNVNTLIVDDSERYGLSQLHQLRGRVGRSTVNAYAFFMYPRGMQLNEESEERLKAIKEFVKLGSGLRISMRDLEIRGAGNVLGEAQHGHMKAIGFELYTKLLNLAIENLQNDSKTENDFETSIYCDLSAYIPPNYVASESERISLYKQIALLKTREEANIFLDGLVDRFGNIPDVLNNLVDIALLKALAHRCFVTELTIHENDGRIDFMHEANIKAENIPQLISEFGGRLKLIGKAKPSFILKDNINNSNILNIISQIQHILKVIEK